MFTNPISSIMKKIFLLTAVSIMSAISGMWAAPREKYNFNSDWLLKVGDIKGAELKAHDDKEWKT